MSQEVDFNTMKPWGMLARCVMNEDHSIAYFLDPDDSNYTREGVEVDWDEVEAYKQNVMVQIPKFYYAKKKVDEIYYFGVSDEPIDNEYISEEEWEIHPAFYRDRSVMCDVEGSPIEVDYRYIGAFHGWMDNNNRLRSLPNKSPTVSNTIGNFRNAAKQMGVGWCQFDYFLLYATQMLYLTEYGHPDSQTMIGRGYVDGNSASINTGGTISKGNNTFGETTGKVQMSYRGIEDLWGNVRNWVDGFFFDSSGNILVGDKGFNNTGSGYTNVGKESSSISADNIRHIQDNVKAGFIPRITSGTDYNDGFYDCGWLYVSSGGRVAYCGGSWSDRSRAGAFCFRAVDSASLSSADVGARLCV